MTRPRRRSALRKNPVLQRRAPYPKEEQGTEFHEDDVNGWVSAVHEALRFSHDAAIEARIGLNEDHNNNTDEDAEAAGEIVLYVAQVRKFEQSNMSDEERENTERWGTWVKQHASVVVRGDVGDVHEMLRWLSGNTDFDGKRLGTLALYHKTPVFLTDRENPDGVWRTLGTALLNNEEYNVYEKILEAAKWVKDYNETNQDSVSDLPTTYFSDSKTTVATRILDGNMYSVNQNGSGWAPARGGKARQDLEYFKELCENDSEGVKILAELRKSINETIKYSDIWCLSDPKDKARPDPDKDYVFMSYETEDMIGDQLPEDVVELIAELPEEGRVTVAAALDHVDVRWDLDFDARDIRVGDVNAHWLFSFNVESLIDEMVNKYPELDENADEDDDADE